MPSDAAHYPHQSVLFQESLDALNLKPGMIVVDGTLGLGGHSAAILKAIAPTGHLYSFDLDERNIRTARPRLEQAAQESGGNFTIIHDSFSSLTDRLKREGVSHADAILFDLGLSSPHIDEADRGFSFRMDGPLDMRFNASEGQTAADLLNTLSEEALADIFYHYGEIHASRRLARYLVEKRKLQPWTRTQQFAEGIQEAFGSQAKTLTVLAFQALRMAVNEELKALELGLSQAVEFLAPQGRVVVLSYHSLEDRFVKSFFKNLSTDLGDPTDIYGRRVLRAKSLSLLNKKPILPTAEEVAVNPRARSAKLRGALKLSTPL